MNIYYLDLLPDYIPFVVQCKNINGGKSNPTGGIDLKIYEQDGGTFGTTDVIESAYNDGLLNDGDFDAGEFDDGFAELPIYKINSKTGYYGMLVPKSIFTANKQYLCLWETTVDNVQTAKREEITMMNSASFQG